MRARRRRRRVCAVPRPCFFARYRSSRSCFLPPLDKRRANERYHRFAFLVDAGGTKTDQANMRPAVGRPRLDYLSLIRDGVADIDRLEPFEPAKTERRTDTRDRFAAGARCLFQAAAMVHHQPHPGCRGMPAGGAERAEMRAPGGGFVEVERLRIETAGEGLDTIGGEGVAADVEYIANA